MLGQCKPLIRWISLKFTSLIKNDIIKIASLSIVFFWVLNMSLKCTSTDYLSKFPNKQTNKKVR